MAVDRSGPKQMKRTDGLPSGLIFVASLILFYGLSYALVPLRFEENDDVVMMMLASGAYDGESTSHLVFINHYLGWGLSTLYQQFPAVDWYPAMMVLALSVCGGFMIVLALQSKPGTARPGLFAGFAVAALLLSVLVNIQYTTVAALSVAIGAWSFLTLRSRGLVLLAGVLVLFGFLLRFDAGVLVVLVGAPLVFVGLSIGSSSARRVAGLCGLLVSAVLINFAGANMYRAVAPDYVAFNELRGAINDNPHAEIAPERLPDGVSEDDYALFLGFFADPEVITLGLLEALHSRVQENANRVTFQEWRQAVVFVLTRPEIYLLLGAVVAAACSGVGWLQSLALVVAGGMFFGLLVWVDVFATLKNRVMLSAAGSILVALFVLNLTQSASRSVKLASDVLLAGLAGFYLASMVASLGQATSRNAVFRDQADLIENWDGTVFVYGSALKIEFAPLFQGRLDPLDEKVVFGGWLVRHPSNARFASHLDLLRDDTAVLLSPSEPSADVAEQLLRVMEKNYGVRAVANTVAQNDNGTLVTFRRQPDA